MKSDYRLPANSGATKQCVSEEERILRWKWANKELPELTEEQFAEYITEVRIKTGKP